MCLHRYASLLGLLFTLLGYYIERTGTGKDAFFALVGATSTLPFIVYFLTVLAYVLRRDRMASLPQAFNLGAWAKPVMFAALAWTLIALGLLMIPKIFWLTDGIVLVVVVLAALWYFAVLRRRLARGEAGVEQLHAEGPSAPQPTATRSQPFGAPRTFVQSVSLRRTSATTALNVS